MIGLLLLIAETATIWYFPDEKMFSAQIRKDDCQYTANAKTENDAKKLLDQLVKQQTPDYCIGKRPQKVGEYKMDAVK